MVLLAASLVGCGTKKKLEEKAGEALAEKIFKGAGVDADIDGDKVVIKGEDGQELTIGKGEWPSSDLAKSIPEFKGGKIVSLMEANDSLFIMIEEVSDEEFTDYLDEVKDTFTGDTYEMNTGIGIIYSVSNSEGIGLMLSYEKDAGLSITVSQADPEED